MSHNVESMFSVKETPWHGLGKIIDQAPTIEEGIKLAGLDWTVKKEALFTKDGRKAPRNAITREDNEKILGVVGSQYKPLQNKDAFNFFQPFLESGVASLVTAGSLSEGEVIWVLAKLNKAPIEIGKNDFVEIKLYFSIK